MKILISALVVALVLCIWFFLTPMLFGHGSSAAFQMGMATIILGSFAITFAIGAHL